MHRLRIASTVEINYNSHSKEQKNIAVLLYYHGHRISRSYQYLTEYCRTLTIFPIVLYLKNASFHCWRVNWWQMLRLNRWIKICCLWCARKIWMVNAWNISITTTGPIFPDHSHRIQESFWRFTYTAWVWTNNKNPPSTKFYSKSGLYLQDWG